MSRRVIRALLYPFLVSDGPDVYAFALRLEEPSTKSREISPGKVRVASCDLVDRLLNFPIRGTTN